MIKNERQYRITKAQAEKFAHALAQLAESRAEEKQVHPILLRAEQEALRSQLSELRAELEEYEALQSGKRSIPQLKSFIELPRALIRARIAKGLTQKDLAERLGLKEQQIQKYEATEYASASLSRVKDVVEALGVKIKDDADIRSQKFSLSLLISRLKEVGLDRDFVTRRLVPATLAARLRSGGGGSVDNLCYQIAAHVARIFNWTLDDVLGSEKLELKAATAFVKFKMPARVNKRQLTAYVVYAHYLAFIVVQSMKLQIQHPIPTDPYEMRKAILSSYGTLTLEHTLRYAWDIGLPVIPLSDPGAFHAACFRKQGQNVIILKQKTSSPSRWMFDLLHDIWHAPQEPEQQDRAIIENEYTSYGPSSSNEERIASQFAGAVLLGKNPQKLAEACLQEADRDLRRLKSAVQKVASRENVPSDSLANYMAFRLSLQDENWWGTAANLQSPGPNPWLTARDVLLEHLDLSKLSEPDLFLLQRALAE